MKRSIVFLLIVALFVCANLLTSPPVTSARTVDQKHPDKVKATKYLTGKLAGFEVGDYTHAIVKPAKGESMSFFIGKGEGLLYFLVAHQGETVTVTYHELSSWIEEAGGYTDIERIASAKTASGQTDTAWWSAERRGSSVTKLRAKYDALLSKATVNP
jgi:hypothetical protein